MNKKFSLNSVELQDYQPNRYPFLMIDYVDEVLPGKYARGHKNLTLNILKLKNIRLFSVFLKHVTVQIMNGMFI